MGSACIDQSVLGLGRVYKPKGLHFSQSVVVWCHPFLWTRLYPPWMLRPDELRQGIHGILRLPSPLQRLLARPCQGSICAGRIVYRVLEEKQNFANHKDCPRGTSWRCPVYPGDWTPDQPCFYRPLCPSWSSNGQSTFSRLGPTIGHFIWTFLMVLGFHWMTFFGPF
jgi:hypothetical protein